MVLMLESLWMLVVVVVVGGDSNVILQNAHYDATGAGTSDSRSDGYNGQVEAALGESSSGGGGIAGIGGGGLSCTNDVLWLNDSPVADWD